MSEKDLKVQLSVRLISLAPIDLLLKLDEF